MLDSAEVILRKTLAEIDDLRKRAATAERMHSHWMNVEHELAIDQTITVKQRRRNGKTTHSEWAMDAEERELFRDFLMTRHRELREKAAALAATLATPSPETEQENTR